MLPVVLATILFVPYSAALIARTPARPFGSLALSLAALLVIGWHVGQASMDLVRVPVGPRDEHHPAFDGKVDSRDPLVRNLALVQWALERIPEDERVIAAGNSHPLWRKDLTYMTADERPSFLEVLDPSDPLRERFEPDELIRRLAEHRPAFISLPGLEINWPPHWGQICVEFLEQHRQDYVDISGEGTVFLRADLMPGQR